MEQNEFPVARRRLCERVDANWASGIPPSWDAPRIKSLLNERNEREHPDQPLLAATQKQGVILKERYENRTVLPTDTDELSQFKLVEKGDFVISLRSFQGGIERAHDKGIISPAYTILRSSKPETVEYLTRLFKSRPFIEILTTCVTGIRQGQNIDYTRLGTQRIPLPPPNEQTAIVRYLDDADQRIRAYVSAKERLIALLEEERQAVIHQAVTRGLDPNVNLKPSGVEWLGDVPEHWDVIPVKRAFLSIDYGISESASNSGVIRVLTMGHVKDGKVIVPFAGGVDDVDPYLLLGENDLLFNRTNSQELVGKVGLFEGHESPVTFASYLVRMRSSSGHEPEYLNIALNDTSFISRARREAIPSLHQSNLNPTRYGRIHIALPPKEEQGTILHSLRKKTVSLTNTIDRVRRQIKLMEEYRTRLIADVVTGKIDVRGAKP